MSEKPVIILGAGATKACGGPLTDEILPAALNGQMRHDWGATAVQDREELMVLLHDFLRHCFNVPQRSPVQKEDCPPLPMVLSMIHESVKSDKDIGGWGGERLIKAKRAIEYSILAVIEAVVQGIPVDQCHHALLEPLYRRGLEPTVVSLNYDVLVDKAMFLLGDAFQASRPPHYCVRITTPKYEDLCQGGTFGRLLKIHGSLNWLYCENCQRLDLFVSPGMLAAKVLDQLYHEVPFGDAYSCRGTPCRNPQCRGSVSPILIAPAYVKSYKNPHIEQVWTEAEWAMKAADRAVIIGYSLPADDVEVALLLQRGLSHLARDRITVVEFVKEDVAKAPGCRTPIEKHDVGRRFRFVFGDGLDWHTAGFEMWLQERKLAREFPFDM